MWLEGFQIALSGTNVWWLLVGSCVGLVVGVLPGLGPTFGVALMLPFTFSLDPATALIFLCAIHAACNYGDSFSSFMLNVPGGPGTVATCWDGYPMAKQGFAGRALGISTLASLIGGVGAWLTLALLAKPITNFAVNLGAPEYFALGIMALGLISVGSKGETVKGLVMACVGLALSFIGDDPISGIGQRFGFGIPFLEAGIPIVVSTLGIFAIAQVIILIEEGGSIAETVEMNDSVWRGFVDVMKRPHHRAPRRPGGLVHRHHARPGRVAGGHSVVPDGEALLQEVGAVRHRHPGRPDCRGSGEGRLRHR